MGRVLELLMTQLSRRRFFVHSAHRTIGVSAGLAALEAADTAYRFAAADQPPVEKPLAVALVSGSDEYRSDETLRAFQTHLEQTGKTHCHWISATKPNTASSGSVALSGLEQLDQCDCMVLFTRRLTLSDRQLEQIKKYCQQGRAIVGIRTASHAFQNWLKLDREVFGGDYHDHYGNSLKPRIEAVAAAQRHTIVAGFEPYTSSGSLYRNPQLASDTTVLLTGEIPGHREPVAWTREYHGGRVFYTSLGHPDDFHQAGFLRLLTNAVFWTSRRPAVAM
jgi:type 1 glutamine amidotransferase